MPQEFVLATLKRYNTTGDGHLKHDELKKLMRDMAKGRRKQYMNLRVLRLGTVVKESSEIYRRLIVAPPTLTIIHSGSDPSEDEVAAVLRQVSLDVMLSVCWEITLVNLSLIVQRKLNIDNLIDHPFVCLP